MISIACSATCERHGVAYLVATNDNVIFTEAVIDDIIDCAGIVILDIPYYPRGSGGGAKEIIEKLHHRRPDLPVLLYSLLSVWYERARHRIAGTILSDIQNNDRWFLHQIKDSSNQMVVFPDVRVGAYQDWVINKNIEAVNELGADGLFIDMAFRDPKVMVQKCRKNPQKCLFYQQEFDRLFIHLKDKLASKRLYFNGFFSGDNIDLTDQLATLQITDGIIVEYFGMNPSSNKSSFEKDIVFYLDQIQRYPEKKILVFGRGTWKENEFSPHWAKYIYAAYLLVSGDNTLFKFHSSFQVPRHAGTTDGLYVLPESKKYLGEPLGPFAVRGDLYERHFQRGYVALCRHDAQRKLSVTVADNMVDVNGNPASGTQDLLPGEAIIAYRKQVK